MPASETTQPPAPGAKSGGAKHKSAGAGGQPAGAARDESAGPRKYASEVAQLRQIFPDYTPDELVEALESKYGDVDLVVDLIASGERATRRAGRTGPDADAAPAGHHQAR